ncbi:MAG: alpha/beta fold hydrolase, partial [Planctomycetota bacterium]|nr:alpha/beta fold hydrolase [Planctomycetota bacterium]
MVHGLLLDNLASWYFGVAPLLSRELARHLYMYDLRGHGKSEHAAAGFDVATQATDLLALLDIWSPTQPVDLVGHSYGGLIALHLARTHP